MPKVPMRADYAYQRASGIWLPLRVDDKGYLLVAGFSEVDIIKYKGETIGSDNPLDAFDWFGRVTARELLVELKKLNKYMSIITGDELSYEDIEEIVI